MERACSLLRSTIWAALALGMAAATASAQSYPDRPVTIVVPAAAGGPTDTVARLVGDSMSRTLGQQIVVENAGGAGGTIGMARVAKAPADGYTLAVWHIGQSTAPALYENLKYNAIEDFDSIGRITDVPMTVVGKADLPIKGIGELLAWMKEKQKGVTYAHAGIGSASHLCALLLMHATKTEMTAVAYRGTGPAMNDLLGGQFDMMCDQTTGTTNPIKAGKIKGYAATTPARLKVLPELPTLDESGLKGFDMTTWWGLMAPARTPPAVVERLAAESSKALQSPDIQERWRTMGSEIPAVRTPAQFTAFVERERKLYAELVKRSGATVD